MDCCGISVIVLLFLICFLCVMFKGLDFVIHEAKRHGIKLILSLVNNYEDYGGKNQYVKWARDQGQNITSDDDFFSNPLVKGFYKKHVNVSFYLSVMVK